MVFHAHLAAIKYINQEHKCSPILGSHKLIMMHGLLGHHSYTHKERKRESVMINDTALSWPTLAVYLKIDDQFNA